VVDTAIMVGPGTTAAVITGADTSTAVVRTHRRRAMRVAIPASDSRSQMP